MIKVEHGKCEMLGEGVTLLSELTVALSALADGFAQAEKTSFDYELNKVTYLIYRAAKQNKTEKEEKTNESTKH